MFILFTLHRAPQSPAAGCCLFHSWWEKIDPVREDVTDLLKQLAQLCCLLAKPRGERTIYSPHLGTQTVPGASHEAWGGGRGTGCIAFGRLHICFSRGEDTIQRETASPACPQCPSFLQTAHGTSQWQTMNQSNTGPVMRNREEAGEFFGPLRLDSWSSLTFL